MRDEYFLKEAFKGHDVPAGLKEAVSKIVTAYEIKGISDPMYIANTIATETGRGNGEGKFWGWGNPISLIKQISERCRSCTIHSE